MIATDTHPLLVTEKLVDDFGEEIVFRFSQYASASQVNVDGGEILSVDGKNLCRGWLEAALTSLKPTQELALHSEVLIGGKPFHIPMIDFRSKVREPELEREILNLLAGNSQNELYIFDSGKSFHGYCAYLLQPDQWRVFMGQLLLLNPRDKVGCIDARWVGHRLVDNYATLRWSCNTDDYQYLPRLVDSHQLLGR